MMRYRTSLCYQTPTSRKRKGSEVTRRRRRKQRQELEQGEELRRRREAGGSRTLRPWRKMKRKRLTEV